MMGTRIILTRLPALPITELSSLRTHTREAARVVHTDHGLIVAGLPASQELHNTFINICKHYNNYYVSVCSVQGT